MRACRMSIRPFGITRHRPPAYKRKSGNSVKMLWLGDCFSRERKGRQSNMKFAIPGFVLSVGVLVGSSLSYAKPEHEEGEEGMRILPRKCEIEEAERSRPVL